MKRLMASLVALLLTWPCYAADAPLFVPMGIFYMNGQFTAVQQFGAAKSVFNDCMTELQQDILSANTHGAVPAGGVLIGACLPVHSIAPVAAPTLQKQSYQKVADAPAAAAQAPQIFIRLFVCGELVAVELADPTGVRIGSLKQMDPKEAAEIVSDFKAFEARGVHIQDVELQGACART